MTTKPTQTKGEKMEKYDVKQYIEWAKTGNKDSFLNCFQGSVAKEVEKCGIKYDLKCRPHTFSDAEGIVVDKLTIEIDFSQATIQPHSAFEEDFCGPVIEAIASEINGLFENADDE